MVFAFVFLFYIGVAALPAFLMMNDHQTAGRLIYRGFYFLCHQYPWRSWFIGGKQSYYPLLPDAEAGLLSFEEAAGIPVPGVNPRAFLGSPEMGYKMAVCQRDVGIYAAMGVFSLLFFLSRNRMPRVDWRFWLIFGVLPIGIDGGLQLISHLIPGWAVRESTPFLRTVTGALFGLFTCWYLLPTLEHTLREGEENDRP